MEEITTCLWYNGQAKEAAEFYCSVFKNSEIKTVSPMVVIFELNGRTFMGLNGGPHFNFNEAISLVVHCKDQDEVDYYWEQLSAVPEAEQCGWVKDKFGMSWQIIPDAMGELMSKSNQEQGERVMNAMLKMKKLIVADLEKAFNGDVS